MTVHVRLFSHLCDLAGASTADVELAEGSTVSDLLEQLYHRLPVLRPHDKTILAGIDLDFVDRAYVLKPADEIAIMPPVQGG